MKKKQTIFAILSIFAITTSALVFATPMENSDLKNNRSINTVYTEDTHPDNVKIRGIWGYMDDRTPDGYFGGKITRKGRFFILRGVFNETNNESRTPFIGVLKKGYFIGKISTENGSYRVTGLYKIDREKHLLKIKWMTARKEGWAVGRIKI